MARTLIIGIDSLIGRTLHARLHERGHEVLGTTRREQAAASHMYLDLSSDPAKWPALSSCDIMVICAAVNGFAACRQSPELSQRVNVDAAEALARRALESGGRVVFLSTSAVFDGTRPLARPAWPVSPTTEYGRQKAEAERRLLALGGAIAVVRLTKVVWPEMPLLVDCRQSLLRGEPIKGFADLRMAPVAADSTATALERIIDSTLNGILHISGAEDVTYLQAAQWLAEELNAPSELIQASSARSAGLPDAERPLHTTLDMTRECRELGLEPPLPRAVMESVFQQMSQIRQSKPAPIQHA
jgi:dTDP-4-dehydrorhamnose reductase